MSRAALAGALVSVLLGLGLLLWQARRRFRARRRLRPGADVPGGELFANASEAILVVAADGRVLPGNARAGRVGRAPAELAGLSPFDIEADAGQGRGEALREPLGGPPSPVEERGFRRRDRDQLERRASELLLREREEALERSRRLEAVGHMAGDFAHDFNNLLVVITGLSEEMLERTPPGSQLRRELEEILSAAGGAQELTRQLLVLARDQATAVRPVVLNERLRNIEDLLDTLLGEHIELRLELADGVGAVSVDPDQLEQAVVDLILRARDATPEGRGVVRLVTSSVPARSGPPTTRQAALRVIDPGADLEAARARLLESSREDGTLDGLAFVRCFAEQAGGDVRALREPDGGTCLELRLPAHEA
jgi:signal transduction histidine kinase